MIARLIARPGAGTLPLKRAVSLPWKDAGGKRATVCRHMIFQPASGGVAGLRPRSARVIPQPCPLPRPGLEIFY
jgi:hypothetical protein